MLSFLLMKFVCKHQAPSRKTRAKACSVEPLSYHTPRACVLGNLELFILTTGCGILCSQANYPWLSAIKATSKDFWNRGFSRKIPGSLT